MPDIPAWLQTAISLAAIVGGAIGVIAKLSHKVGLAEAANAARHEAVKVQFAAIDAKFKEMKDCGNEDHEHFYGRLNNLDQQMAVVKHTQNRHGQEIQQLKQTQR